MCVSAFNLTSREECNSAAVMLALIGISEILSLHLWDSPLVAVRQLMFNDLSRVLFN